MEPVELGTAARQRQMEPFRLEDARKEPMAESTPPTPTPTPTPTALPASVARLLAIGIGGGGSNAINRMIEASVHGVEFIAMNTDAQALELSRAPIRMRLGETLTRGLGAGGNPDVGRQAAEESYNAIHELLAGTDMAFITAGMGGGTGTGAAPLVAQAAREQGALTVAIVTMPFAFERRRKMIAEQGLAALREVVDALIIVPNERLMQLAGRDMSAFEAYRMADDVLRQGIQGISDLITIPGLINLDFADVRAVMEDAGSALMAVGQASGENRAEQAAQGAIANPLLDVDISGARGVVFNITGSDDLTMYEVNRIADIISGAAHPEANIIFGTVFDQGMAGTLKVTVVATGFEPRVTYDRQRQGKIHTAASATPIPTAAPVPAGGSRASQTTAAETAGATARQAATGTSAASKAPRSFVHVGSPAPDNFMIAVREPPDEQESLSEPIPLPRERMHERAMRLGDDWGMRPAQPMRYGHKPAMRGLPMAGDENEDDSGEDSVDGMSRSEVSRQPQPGSALPGYHGDEFVTNDEEEDEENEPIQAPHHRWERFLNLRR